ncbi:putative S-layer protein [Candidatus Woesearchaeota archaeon]|nr:putative S-layer protein [Candidatus Woesearchaeota archaeon]MCF7900665.1 putative S-layer protein [Candidatus Woesearchaeota archaeon]MCF8013500.1 putative S-layer protein [Candidatus Woesearchaeota archaeon]
MKISQITTTFIVLLLLAVIQVSAQSTGYNISTPNESNLYMSIKDVDVNDFDDFFPGSVLQVKRGEELEIKVAIEAGDLAITNGEVEASIKGYRYADEERSDVTDYSDTFDLKAGRTITQTLNLKIPTEMDKNDLELRIRLTDRNNPTIEYLYRLDVAGIAKENALQIKKFFISPSSTIEAGRALSFKVQVENMGDGSLDDVSVEVSIPELGLTTYETIDQINQDDVESFEALLLRIPTDAAAGTYNVVAKVDFDKYESEDVTKTIQVTERVCTSTTCVEGNTQETQKTVVTMPQSLEAVKGTPAVYPVMVNNKADVAKTYVVSVTGTDDWATVQIQPSAVVVIAPGASQTVYLNVKPNQNAAVGDKVFQVAITSGNDVSTTNVVAKIKDSSANTTGLRSVLEWALVILVVILIILGLIVLIAKVKKNNKDEDEDSETYY